MVFCLLMDGNGKVGEVGMKEAIIQYNDTPSGGHMAISWKPLVRCKDCKWWHESETNKGYGDCGQANGITLKSSDWFCADGERAE